MQMNLIYVAAMPFLIFANTILFLKAAKIKIICNSCFIATEVKCCT